MYRRFEAKDNYNEYEIMEEIPGILVNLYVYHKGLCIKDEHQDTLETCKRIALRDWGVPYDAWMEIIE